jgi:DHA2 family multidrug resistance protein
VKDRSPWLIAFTVTLATFMEVLDTSIANVALPHIAGNLSVGVDESTWVLTSYLVANAIVLPVSGWISALVGRKRFYISCVILFTTSSALCGLAPNLGALIFFRVLQGLGGGGLQPSEQSILADTFPPEKRGMAFAFYGFAVVAAPAIGPTLGGWVTDNVSWRWIFYINVPVGVLSVLLSTALLRDPDYLVKERARRRREGWRIDFAGLGLIALGLGALQVVLDKGEREDWFASRMIIALSIVAAVALVLAVIRELTAKDPVIELSLLGERNFGTACALMVVLGVVLLGSTVLLPQFSQQLLGYTATWAGLALSPGALLIMAMMPVVGILVTRIDARVLVLFGLVSGAVALLGLAQFSLDVDFRKLVLARCAQAIGLAFLFVPINTLSYAYVPPGKSNAASGLINLARNIGGSVGISAVTTLLARRTQVHQSYLAAHLTPYDPALRHWIAGTARGLHEHTGGLRAYRALAQEVGRQASMLAYADSFRALAMCFTVSAVFLFLVKRVKPGATALAH